MAVLRSDGWPRYNPRSRGVAPSLMAWSITAIVDGGTVCFDPEAKGLRVGPGDGRPNLAGESERVHTRALPCGHDRGGRGRAACRSRSSTMEPSFTMNETSS